MRLFLQHLRHPKADPVAHCAEQSDRDIHNLNDALTSPDNGSRLCAASGMSLTDDERAAMRAKLMASLPIERAFWIVMTDAERLAWVTSHTFDDARDLRIKLGPNAECLTRALQVERAAVESSARAVADRAYRDAMVPWAARKR